MSQIAQVPDLPRLTNPIGVNLVIDRIQTALKDKIPYLQKSLPRVYRKHQTRNDGTGNTRYFAPFLYLENRQYFNVEPDTTISCFCFWHVLNSNTLGFYNRKSANVDLIVFGNYELINPALDELFLGQVENDFSEVLRTREGEIINSYDIEYGVQEAFDEFDYTSFNQDFSILENNFALKFNLDLAYVDVCTP